MSHGSAPRRVHQRAALVGVGFRDQPLGRHVAEARVADVAVAVVIGELLGLDHEMDVVGAEERLAAQVERLEQVQHLEHREALGRRRRLVDRHAAIGADDRLAPARLLRLEVAGGEEAVVGLATSAPALSPPRRRRSRTSRRSRSPRSVRARFGFFSTGPCGRKIAAASGLFSSSGARDVAPVGEPRRHREAVARIADRAVEAALQRQAAVGGMRLGPARHRAGHGERAGQHAAIGHFGEAALREGVDRAAATWRGRRRRCSGPCSSSRRGSARRHRRRCRSCADREPTARRSSPSAASTAEPPARSTSTPAALASECGEVTMPFGASVAGRPVRISVMRSS